MERGSSKHGPKRDDELAHEMQGTLKGNRSRGAQERGAPGPPPPHPPPPGARPRPEGQAVGGEAAVDGDIGQIDVAQHGVHRAADRCRRREGGLRGAV
ncbi:hypothetical protein, partial [Nocardia cyriacigeorgica]|uniref:hypothetical protein n=1 Tax=Nocardia cyriacigeorgica TaxID=135487 RepID=UPI002458EA8F